MNELIRPYEDKDHDACEAMLEGEGYAREEMGFANIRKKNKTWVFSEGKVGKGFFTMRMVHGLPYIVHFVTSKFHRDFTTGRALWSAAKEVARDTGAPALLVNCPVKDKKRAKMMEHLFEKKPYAEENGMYYWMVKV